MLFLSTPLVLTVTAGNVIARSHQLIRQILLLHPASGEIVRILVIYAMSQLGGTGIMRITQVVGHAAAVTAAHICTRFGNAHIGSVALRCVGDIAHCLRQRYLCLRPADKIGSLSRSVGYHQCLRSARPTSSAAQITTRRATKRTSSPPSIMRAR